MGFTTETDGRLPCGKTLKEAVEMVYAQEHKPVDFIINCSHADHFVPTLRYMNNRFSHWVEPALLFQGLPRQRARSG